MTLLYNLFCRRDRKSLKNYDFLWEVMEENIRKNNKVSKPALVFSSPPGLVDLCFSVLRRQKVVHHVLDPLKVQKINSSMNTDDDDDDTISMMSFQDPVDFDDSLEEDMNLDNILQPPFIGLVLPCYVPPIPTPVIGAKLLGTKKKFISVRPTAMDTQTNGTVREIRDGGTVQRTFQLYPYSISQGIWG